MDGGRDWRNRSELYTVLCRTTEAESRAFCKAVRRFGAWNPQGFT
jgi:hypothetical protein